MITVVQPGLFTTVQDEGRWGYQAYGMPVAGAMDSFAYGAVNAMVGNNPGAAVLEMTHTGGMFQFHKDTVVAIGGADMTACLNGQAIENWTAFAVAAGSELAFGYARSGCRAYMAVGGGIDTLPVLGSRSTYTRANVGGYQGRALVANDSLPIGEATGVVRLGNLPVEYLPVMSEEVTVRIVFGPQENLFTAAGRETLLTTVYTITEEADRMGYRLVGSKIEHIASADIVSDALPFGAIQVPGHGMPIVMMADRQTTGGYAKIGVVISADLPKLAQAKPGDRVCFALASDEQAVAALQEQQEKLHKIAVWCRNLQQGRSCRQLQVRVNGHVYHVEVEEE